MCFILKCFTLEPAVLMQEGKKQTTVVLGFPFNKVSVWGDTKGVTGKNNLG